MRPWTLLLVIRVLAVFAVTLVAGENTSSPEELRSFLSDEADYPDQFSSQLGAILPEHVLPENSTIALVKVASRLVGRDAWPVTDKLVNSLALVSRKLSIAVQADCKTEVFPSPLAFTSVRGLGLKEAKHLSDAPCARPCTKRVYPAQGDFEECKLCSTDGIVYKHHDLAGIEILITLNYSRKSQLVGATQSSMANSFVRLLKAEGTEVKLIGSTYRLTPSAAKFAKYLPLDALSFRYVAWEVHVEFSGPNVIPFCIEKENLILGLWQVQQPGQDFRIKQVKTKSDTRLVLHFVCTHIPTHDSKKLLTIWQERVQWLSSELDKKGIAGTEVKILKAFEVFDETLADQFSILAGKSRGPVPLYKSPVGLLSIAGSFIAVAVSVWFKKGGWHLRKVAKLGSGTFPIMAQFACGNKAGRLSLSNVPLRMGGIIDVVDITICRRPDGSDWLLGTGSSGKVFRGIKNGVQPVAVKVLAQSDDMQLSQFAKEIALLRRLSFDGNIVQFYGACLQRENTMMVLEYMAGGDLMGAIANDRQNKLRWSRKGHSLALDIARGLVHLHANKVIHMDLKSQNILLNRDQTVAKIADVGLSRGLHSSVSNHSVGTLQYSAPEVLLGRYCNEKADIFSYGVILWELVTHEQPMRGSLRDCKVPQECPEAVDKLIDSCMQEDPEVRPSAKEICETIRQWQQAVFAKRQSNQNVAGAQSDGIASD